MTHSLYVVAVNGNGSPVFGSPRLGDPDKRATMAIPIDRLRKAEKLAEEWPTAGQIVIYKLVPVKNVWHDPKERV